jgi:hypothetical protein
LSIKDINRQVMLVNWWFFTWPLTNFHLKRMKRESDFGLEPMIPNARKIERSPLTRTGAMRADALTTTVMTVVVASASPMPRCV